MYKYVKIRDKKKRRCFVMTSVCNDKTSLCNEYVAYRKAIRKYNIHKDVSFRFCFSLSPMSTLLCLHYHLSS